MILAEDLIRLLQRVDPRLEVVVYEGERSGLHLSYPNDEPFGWIEIGDYEDRVMLDDPNHLLDRLLSKRQLNKL